MKLLLILSLLTGFTYAIAQEEVVEEQVTVTETPVIETPVVSQEVAVETNEEEVTPVVEKYSEDAPAIEYADLIKVYAATNKVKDAEEIVWSLTDDEYAQTKQNEFAYQKVKDEKIKEAKKAIEESKNLEFGMNVSLVLGTYDFKKESYPVKGVVMKNRGIVSLLGDTDLIKYPTYINSHKSNIVEKFELPTSIELKVVNLSKLTEMKLNKDLAEKLASNLGASRQVSCVLEIGTPTMKYTKKKPIYGKVPMVDLKANASYKKTRCYSDELRTDKIAEF